MTALLSLIGALVVGGSDFAGGYAARQTSPFRVTAWVQAASLIALLIGCFFVAAPTIRTTDVVAGIAGGAAATFSFAALYRAFSDGQISLLAPTAAIGSAVLPVGVALFRGDSIRLINWVGVIVAFVAISLVSQSKAKPGDPDHTPPQAFVLAAIAGAGFALFFLALAETSENAGLWPLVIARLVSVPVVIVLAIALSGGLGVPTPVQPALYAAGAAEAIANICALYAFQRGPLTVAAVISALFPVSTVILARVVLDERLRTQQWVGVGLALLAVPLVAVP